MIQNKKVKIFKFAPIHLKFVYTVKIGLIDLFLKFRSILTIFERVTGLYNFEFVNVRNYCSIKPLVFMLKYQNFNTI